ncbi:MAG: PASTA domain-containing protein, partial [Clostridia bacterium]|nr:PASTA domain-containing protein [Clostridia bacterium]
MKENNAAETRRRVRWLVVGFFALFCAVIGRLFYLQVIKYDNYQAAAIDNVQRETTVAAARGIIYDANMRQLATNTTVWRVFVSPVDMENEAQAKQICASLSEILDVDYDTILARALRENRKDETIKNNVEEADAQLVLTYIEENGFQNQIHLEASSKRYYPYGNLAAHVIGITGTDGGLFGLEYQYDTYLQGIPGRYITSKNGVGKNMPTKYDTYIEAENGYNVLTTIDMTVQLALENQLKATYYDSDPLSRVTGVVMNVNTGAVLGMGTYPDMNLNDAWTLAEEYQQQLDASGLVKGSTEYNQLYTNLVYTMWNNKAVSGLYEPGSTMKVMTTAMALEEKIVRFDEQFYCSGVLTVANVPIRCHRRQGHGQGTYAYLLQQSCNPTLMTVAARLGEETFYNYFRAFGYTEKTGIDLPGEASGIYHDLSGFNQVELATYSFGQTFKTTALQQITAISAVANGGYLVTPHVVSALLDDEGNVVTSIEPDAKRQIISTDVCKSITEVLEDGVSGNGGAKNAYVAGYKVAAKTGTSEVRDVLNEEGESYLRVGSCVAYAPAENPQVAAIIVVDSPQCESVYGSVVAAPYISNLLGEILPYLGVERQYTDKELESMIILITDYTGYEVNEAKAAIEKLGLDVVVRGSGDKVNYQMPRSGSSMMLSEGKIILYTEGETPAATLQVPNLSGMTAAAAN